MTLYGTYVNRTYLPACLPTGLHLGISSWGGGGGGWKLTDHMAVWPRRGEDRLHNIIIVSLGGKLKCLGGSFPLHTPSLDETLPTYVLRRGTSQLASVGFAQLDSETKESTEFRNLKAPEG